MSPFRSRTIEKALYKQKFADSFFCSRYRFSPYGGCAHGCRYCDGRAEKYYFEGDFEKDIIIRENIAEKLKHDLRKIREKALIDAGSGISDIYQPAEQSHRLMRACIKVINEHNQAILFSTKSAAVLEDLPLWGETARKNGLVFMMSLITLNERERKIFEPGASPISERLYALEQFAKAGATTGVLMMPLLTGINDQSERVEELIGTLKECGVSFIIPGTLTLRPGRQKRLYLKTVEKYYPETLSCTRRVFSENRTSGNSLFSYREAILPPLLSLLNKNGFSGLIDHKYYKGLVSLADEMTILLSHLAYLYKGNTKAEERLDSAAKHWYAWLGEARKDFNRRRSLPNDYLDQLIRDFLQSEERKTLFGNEKTADFFTHLLKKDIYFDYQKKGWRSF